VNADIAFNEVEARVAEETTDRVRPDIQTVDFVVVVGEQTLGQVVTDKTVDAKISTRVRRLIATTGLLLITAPDTSPSACASCVPCM
jgi:hypothetical protein